jgi:murein L,D-transpeptidase YcbB/YkuD
VNPISVFFALASRQADIRRGLAVWQQIKPQVTYLIDLIRDIGAEIGMLEAKRDKPSSVPVALRQYTTQWVQTSLNTLQDANLEADGDIGRDGSKTRVAVKKFQKEHGLKPDGIPGVQTVSIMVQELDKLAKP